MRQATILLVIFTTFSVVAAHSAGNNYNIHPDSPQIKLTSMQGMLSEILTVIGEKENFELKEANVLNIEAKMIRRKKYILYNPAFISGLKNATKEKWSVMALLAHEVGHHLIGHTNKRSGSKPNLELEADEFAGYVLQRLGATLDQSQNVMHLIAKKKETRSHPSRSSRLSAIEAGWKKALVSEQATAGN